MRGDRHRWDQRYAGGIACLDGPPVRYLVTWLPVLPRGRALDIAAGCGRHAIYLAQHGYRVDALDISLVGLTRLMQRAGARRQRVRAAVVDLDGMTLPAATYDLIVITYYLNRELFRRLPQVLVPGGALLVETPYYDPARDAPEEVVRRPYAGELPGVFAGLDVAHYEEEPARPPRRMRGICRMVAFRPEPVRAGRSRTHGEGADAVRGG